MPRQKHWLSWCTNEGAILLDATIAKKLSAPKNCGTIKTELGTVEFETDMVLVVEDFSSGATSGAEDANDASSGASHQTVARF